MNSKKENSEDFCPNYVQEFSLRTLLIWGSFRFVLYICGVYMLIAIKYILKLYLFNYVHLSVVFSLCFSIFKYFPE